MRGLIVDGFLYLASGCNQLGEFFKNCGLEVWRRRRPEPVQLRGRPDHLPLIVTKTEIGEDR
jgi:hypothetical protein